MQLFRLKTFKTSVTELFFGYLTFALNRTLVWMAASGPQQAKRALVTLLVTLAASEPSEARRARRLTSAMRHFKGTMQSMMRQTAVLAAERAERSEASEAADICDAPFQKHHAEHDVSNGSILKLRREIAMPARGCFP